MLCIRSLSPPFFISCVSGYWRPKTPNKSAKWAHSWAPSIFASCMKRTSTSAAARRNKFYIMPQRACLKTPTSLVVKHSCTLGKKTSLKYHQRSNQPETSRHQHATATFSDCKLSELMTGGLFWNSFLSWPQAALASRSPLFGTHWQLFCVTLEQLQMLVPPFCVDACNQNLELDWKNQIHMMTTFPQVK